MRYRIAGVLAIIIAMSFILCGGSRGETITISVLNERTMDSSKLIGSIVKLGRYEQDADLENGQEEIEWIVLDVQEKKCLLLSRYGLDVKQYNTYYADTTWEECTLRTWLNEEFMNEAFSVTEQKKILLTMVDNSSAQGNREWSTDGGNDTKDKIFLLSYAEAHKYLNVTRSNIQKKSRVSPTVYALRHGAFDSYRSKTEEANAAGWWWLRSPGYFQHAAAYVNHEGANSGRSVRPFRN